MFICTYRSGWRSRGCCSVCEVEVGIIDVVVDVGVVVVVSVLVVVNVEVAVAVVVHVGVLVFVVVVVGGFVMVVSFSVVSFVFVVWRIQIKVVKHLRYIKIWCLICWPSEHGFPSMGIVLFACIKTHTASNFIG